MSECSHKQPKKQMVGEQFWYACECGQKFRIEPWDGKVSVLAPPDPRKDLAAPDWRALLMSVVEGVDPFQSGRDGDECSWCRIDRDRKIDGWQASQKAEYHAATCEFALAVIALAEMRGAKR